MSWTWTWLGVALLIAAATIIVAAIIVAASSVIRTNTRRGLVVGVFTCHDCPTLYVTVPLPRKAVQDSQDADSAGHRGHRIATSQVDV